MRPPRVRWARSRSHNPFLPVAKLRYHFLSPGASLTAPPNVAAGKRLKATRSHQSATTIASASLTLGKWPATWRVSSLLLKAAPASLPHSSSSPRCRRQHSTPRLATSPLYAPTLPFAPVTESFTGLRAPTFAVAAPLNPAPSSGTPRRLRFLFSFPYPARFGIRVPC